MAAIYNIQECLLTIQIGKEIIEEFRTGIKSVHSIDLEYRNGDGTLFRRCTLRIHGHRQYSEELLARTVGGYFSILKSNKFCLAETIHNVQLFFLRRTEFYNIPIEGIEESLCGGKVKIHIKVI